MELLYEQLLQFDFKYSELYEMTVNEMVNTLTNRKKGLAYFLWKSGNLNQFLAEFPETPEDASPELYPQPTIKIPNCLKQTAIKKEGGMMISD